MNEHRPSAVDTGQRRTKQRLPGIWLPILFALCCGSGLMAHDFWIKPSIFTPRPGTVLPVRLFVGDHFRSEPFARSVDQIERFAALGPEGPTEIVGMEGSDPAGYVRLTQPGLHVLAYRSRRNFTRLGGAQFEAYLAEEGLEKVRQARADQGESDQTVFEAFSRCAKALIQVGEKDSAAGESPVGLELELLALKNPYALSMGEGLPVRLLYRGEPLAGALVSALRQNDAASRTAARTDENGEATLTLDRGGLWMVRTVHMVRPPSDVEADWESLWASLTFELQIPG